MSAKPYIDAVPDGRFCDDCEESLAVLYIKPADHAWCWGCGLEFVNEWRSGYPDREPLESLEELR